MYRFDFGHRAGHRGNGHSKIRKDDCLRWAAKLLQPLPKAPRGHAPSLYNNTVGTLRQILDLVIEKGALYGNAANSIGKRRPTQKKLTLPTREQFSLFVNEIRTAGAWCSQGCADLVSFLAYGGFRKEEAANVQWGDCDCEKGQIHVSGTPRTAPETESFAPCR